MCVTSAVRLLPDAASWDIDFVNKIRGTPWRPSGDDPAGPREGEVGIIPAGRPLDLGHHEQPRPAKREGISRELYVKREHLATYGYTEGCIKCRSIREGFIVSKGHSIACRERLTKSMKDGGDTEDLDKAEGRNMRFL